MVTTFYPPQNFGGDGIYVQRLVNSLRACGHHVQVLYNANAYKLLGGKNTDPQSDIFANPLLIPFGKSNTLMMQQLGHPGFARSAIKKILEQEWDVIHFHNVSLMGAPHILSFGDAVKIYTMHEYWLICPMHLLLKNNRKVCQRPSCFTCSLAHHRPPQWWRYTHLLQQKIQHIDAFISLSQFCATLHQEKGIQQPIYTLPLFTFPQKLVKLQPQRTPYFLYVGRLEKLKGVQNIIPIFKRRNDLHLKIIGKGSYEHELRKLAGHASNIEFLGYKPQQQLQEFYRNAIALILPSICYEISGTVLLEAYHQQTPVIVNNLGGMPEYVQPYNSGFVYNNLLEFETSVDKLLDRKLRDSLGQNGYTSIQQRFNKERHLEQYLNIIQHVQHQRHHSGL